MTTSPSGKLFIQGFEALRCIAYLDCNGVWTIGWGHTHNVKAGDRITRAEAEVFLSADLAEAERIVSQWVTVPLSQNQFDALVSFVFNIGSGSPGRKDGFVWLKSLDVQNQPRHSTLLRKLLARDFAGAALEFPKWNHAGETISLGLTRRRNAEMQLFLVPDFNCAA